MNDHSLSVPSHPAVTHSGRPGRNAIAATGRPSSTVTGAAADGESSAGVSCAVPSALAVATSVPSGLNATSSTLSRCFADRSQLRARRHVPQQRLAVESAGHQPATGGIERQPVDRVRVALEAMRQARRAGRQIPHAGGVIAPARRQHGPVSGAEGDAPHAVRVPADVPQLHRLVVAAGRQPLAVGTEGERADASHVAGQRQQKLARRRVPDHRLPVAAALAMRDPSGLTATT